uniref:RGS domain-containing protein n=1 Tax=Steinernema glaseri TaxID=37863 RepID=A0A1I8AN87_9BILA
MKAKAANALESDGPAQSYYTRNVRRLFGKKGTCNIQLKYDDPKRAEETASAFFLLNVHILLNRQHLLDFFESLTDVDKQLIKDYIAAENSQEGCINYFGGKVSFEDFEDAKFEEPNFANMSTAVTNLYREMQTAIEIPRNVDPETKEFAKEARKILAHYDALSVEDKVAFQGAFPAIKGHIDGIRLLFKLDSYLKLYPRTYPSTSDS